MTTRTRDVAANQRRDGGNVPEETAVTEEWMVPAMILAIYQHRRRISQLLNRLDDPHRQTVEAAVTALAAGRTCEDATAELQLALDAYDQAGAQADARRIRRRMQARTARSSTPRGRDRAVEGWDSLTDGEQRVVALVAEGLTNREAAARAFLSRHTVDFHLRQIFRKLNVSSRVELVRLSVEHGAIAI